MVMGVVRYQDCDIFTPGIRVRLFVFGLVFVSVFDSLNCLIDFF